jgi:hypothetical protein
MCQRLENVTIPKLILEYEAKQRGLTAEDLLKKLKGVWKFDHLQGHYLFTFVEKNPNEGNSQTVPPKWGA